MDRWLRLARGGQSRALVSLLTITLGLLSSGLAWGINAYPGDVTTSQPDGTDIVIRGFGDEHYNWLEDANGYTIVKSGDWYQYAAVGVDGKLVGSGLKVGVDDPAANGVVKGVQVSDSVRGGFAKVMPPNLPDIAPLGTIKNLVILVRFSDHTGRTQPTEANIDVLMNATSPDPSYAPTGSLRALYLENSYGQMTLDSTVANWATVSNTEAYYANGVSGDQTLHEALRQALDAADAYINFDDFDTDNDGWIDSITFLHSGYGAEWSGDDVYGTSQADRIWSHRWSMSTWTSNEGVRVSAYHISPAVWGKSGSAIGRVGVIAHETGHFFGLPDMYDTNGGGEGIGSWGLMANSWDFSYTQLCPPHFSPYSKEILGWYSPTVISDPGQYTLNEAEFNPEVYKIQSGYPSGEYLLIENRQDTGFDCTIPQGGLVIWHVDETSSHNTEGYPGQGSWPANGNHYKLAVLQADGQYHLEKGNNRGDGGDAHHGGGVDAIGPGPGGHPNTDAYQGGTIISTGHVISDISASGPSMTFCLNGCIGLTAPSNLSANATGSNAIALSWTDNSGSDETGFTIEHSTNGSSWSAEASVGADVTVYTDTALTPGTTHYYRVRAFNATDTSGWSNTASDTTDDVPPATPTGLSATADGENVIDLAWTDASNNEDGFRIERSTSSGSGFAQVASVGAGTTAWSDSGLSASTTYYYRVYAFNTFDSPGFASANARTDDPPPIQRFNAYADQFGSGLVDGTYTRTHADDGSEQWIEEKVSGGKKRDRTTYLGHFWRFNIASGDAIRVYANAYSSGSADNDTFDFAWSDTDQSSDYVNMFNVSETNTDNIEMGTIPNSVSGEVWIRVLDTDRGLGNSSSRDRIYIDELYIEVENFGPPTVPADPTALSVTNVDFNEISIAWTDNANNEDEYRVEGSDDGSSWSQIAVLGTNAGNFTETGLANGTTRHYRVRAWNGVGFSGYSNTDSGTTLIPEPPPSAPFNLTASANGYSSISLNWEHDPADITEDGFRVQRSTNGTNYTIIGVAGGPNTTTYEDTTVAPDTTYWYQVHAYNNSDSAWSNADSATTDPGPATLTLNATGRKVKGKKTFDLTWSPYDDTPPVDQTVEIKLDGVVQTVTSDTGSFTLNTNLKGGGSHVLQVCQTGGGICSNEDTVTF